MFHRIALETCRTLVITFKDAYLVDIAPCGGHYIHSSSEPFHEQMALDHERLRSWLCHFNIRSLGELGSPFLSSGHLTGSQLVNLVEEISPRYLIPVHTEKPNKIRQMVQAKMGKTVQIIFPKPGEPLILKR